MTFKLHLFIISIIVVLIFFSWQGMLSYKQGPRVAEPVIESTNKILIAHASWGLNCLKRYEPPPKALKDDNVKEAISKLCNDKDICSIAINTEALGTDPAPTCVNKLLKIEYRCFSYDRIHSVEAASGILHIICAASPKNEQKVEAP